MWMLLSNCYQVLHDDLLPISKLTAPWWYITLDKTSWSIAVSTVLCPDYWIFNSFNNNISLKKSIPRIGFAHFDWRNKGGKFSVLPMASGPPLQVSCGVLLLLRSVTLTHTILPLQWCFDSMSELDPLKSASKQKWVHSEVRGTIIKELSVFQMKPALEMQS